MSRDPLTEVAALRDEIEHLRLVIQSAHAALAAGHVADAPQRGCASGQYVRLLIPLIS
jgi:hypothetical protein